MPDSHKGEGGKPWKVVEIGSGRVVGASNTKEDAEASARIRNAHHHEKERRRR